MTTIISEQLDPAYDYHVRPAVADGWSVTELDPDTTYVLIPDPERARHRHTLIPCTLGAGPEYGSRTWLEYRDRRSDLGRGPAC